MSLKSTLLRALAAAALVHAALWAPAVAQAQNNSREAAEAVRKHRAEQGGAQRATPPAEPTKPKSGSWRGDAYRVRGDPNADPRASLKSCLDNSGMNMGARDRCMRQHCQGRWGEGDCPRQGGDVIDRSGANERTPLGRCLKDAGANPFKRDACGWRHCNNKWDTPECAAVKPRGTPSAQ